MAITFKHHNTVKPDDEQWADSMATMWLTDWHIIQAYQEKKNKKKCIKVDDR